MRTRLSSSTASIVVAGLVAVLGSAGCGSDDDNPSHGNVQAGAGGSGDVGDDDDDNQSTGGTDVSDDDDDNDATGGKQSAGAAGTESVVGGAGVAAIAEGGRPESEQPVRAGQGGEQSIPSTLAAGAAGEGSTAPIGDEILDDLIEAVCDWEFKCCDAGERKYRLSPFIQDAADCKERFVYELRQSNETQNPYVAGSPVGVLLSALAYVVDLDRVTVNVSGVQACIAQQEALGCMTEEASTLPEHCAGPVEAGDDACALRNLFEPKLRLGEECTLALGQNAVGTNDIECLPGSTCIQGTIGDRPVCVRRGEQDDPCTNDDACDFDFYCNDAGRCTAKADVGEDCSYEDPDAPIPGEEHDPCKVGLTCNPSTEVCVDNCSVETLCNADSECPEGTSCAPLTVNDDSETFHVCRALGKASSARCDDANDCEADWYCSAQGVCAADVSVGDDCTVDAQCPEGTYCSTDSQCAAFADPGAVCIRDNVQYAAEECGPTRSCIYSAEDANTVCSTAKLDLGIECTADFDCKSGLCERDDEGNPTNCIAGADAGDDCDDNVNTADRVRCAPGLVCIEGACVGQRGPGEGCEAEAGGAPDPLMCANGSCSEQWESFMCTDQLVPKTSGGTGLVCDGAD